MLRKQTRGLITGIAGFCGSHLAEFLLQQGVAVTGIEPEGMSLENLEGVLDRIDLRRVDIRDSSGLQRLLSELRPDVIYHLAAITKPDSTGSVRELYDVNVCGTICLLDTIIDQALDARILIAGSSAQYGFVVPKENPIQETQPLRPVTHYAVSKASQDLLGYRYWKTDGLQVVRTRAFNIVGPRQGPGFAASAFAKQVAMLEHSHSEPVIRVGNLEARRDFTDVRDVVRAYYLVMQHGEAGQAYNISSGQGVGIHKLLDHLVDNSTRSGIRIQKDPARMQAADVPVQVGDFSKTHQQTGWLPSVAIEQSMRELLDHWRRKISE